MKKKRSGKLIKVAEGDYKDKTGKIYNNESPVNGNLQLHLDDGTKILIASYKCRIYGYFD